MLGFGLGVLLVRDWVRVKIWVRVMGVRDWVRVTFGLGYGFVLGLGFG